ncbi:MAG: acetylxylan esterase [bacterium]
MKKAVCMFGAMSVSAALAVELPDVLKTVDGQTVDSVAVWETDRRPEILELFKAQVFGRNPVERPPSLRFEATEPGTEVWEGKALRKRINICYSGPGGEGTLRVVAFLPKAAKPAPAFLLIGNLPELNIDPGPHLKFPLWPAKELVARGYAAVSFQTGDVDPDSFDGFTNGVHGVFQPDPKVRTASSWGTLAAWAWGASRIMDWIEAEPLIDRTRVAVVGHSRWGKTALWCGASDARFALTISNDSGCGGAKLNRLDLPKSEHIARINKVFPHWFCDNYKKYGDNESALPLDQHMLVALLAPRLAYVASASDDDWAGQPGEFRSCVLASPVWQLYGKKGLVGDTFPAVETPLQEGCVGYHVRAGKHDLARYDWERYMDFADKNL